LTERKWLAGVVAVRSLDAIWQEALLAGGGADVQYIWWQNKAYHPRVISSWQLAIVGSYIRGGALTWAILNPKYRPKSPGPSAFCKSIYGDI
jgi:hypothetical protein